MIHPLFHHSSIIEMIEESSRENTESRVADIVNRRKLFHEYKKKLLIQVVLLLVICFCIILERIFYEVDVRGRRSL